MTTTGFATLPQNTLSQDTLQHEAALPLAPANVVPFAARQVIHVDPWTDELTAEFGHDPRSAYAERFWLSIVGPSAMWLLRTIAYGFDDKPMGYDMDMLQVARTLGLGDRVGRHSPVQRAIERLCHFEVARIRGGVTLVCRPMLPWLDDRRINNLPEQLKGEHQQWEDAALAESARTVTKRRASAVALACARSDGTPDDIRRTLQAWRYDPVGIEELTAWALTQTEHRQRLGAP
jgi:hypothetical protein